jgi:IS30 family transposase
LLLDQKLQSMSQITQEQRYIIETLLNENYSKPEIAKRLKKDVSTIYREIKRNCDKRNNKYRAVLAHRRCVERHSDKNKSNRFTSEVKGFIEYWIKQEYSPEQIVGRAKEQGLNCVSHERIYQYIWKDKKQGGDLYLSLRSQGKVYRKRGASKDKRGQIIGRIDIDQRPKSVEERKTIGDLEIDLMIGAGHKGALLTINDRATGVAKIRILKSKEATEVNQAIIDTLQDWTPFLKTITSDNGKEFAQHQKVSQILEIDYYFAKPYHSWERGSNENMNGLIRQYFPKGMNFENITDIQVQNAEDKLNNRPRKRFGYKTPNEVFINSLNNNGQVAFMT